MIQGNVWVAIWGKGCVLCFDKDGQLLREIMAKDAPYLSARDGLGRIWTLFSVPVHLGGDIGGKDGGTLFRIDAGVGRFEFGG